MVRLCRADSLAEGQARGFDPTGSGQATVIACRYQGHSICGATAVRIWIPR
ncbi:Rieske (2Fe-2S) iron-sulfur domain-containing protein [Klebsiella variicola]|nr:Rieske (2Fe-2S) iron-sulfur domain-containing protein [Klebsiella variicola]